MSETTPRVLVSPNVEAFFRELAVVLKRDAPEFWDALADPELRDEALAVLKAALLDRLAKYHARKAGEPAAG